MVSVVDAADTVGADEHFLSLAFEPGRRVIVLVGGGFAGETVAFRPAHNFAAAGLGQLANDAIVPTGGSGDLRRRQPTALLQEGAELVEAGIVLVRAE